MHYSWIILDADGTLLDFRRAERVSLQTTPAQLGLALPEPFVDTYYRVNARLWQAFEAGEISARSIRTRRFREVFDEVKMTGDPDQFSETFLENVIRASTFLPGAERLLARLHGRVGLVLLTNGFSDVQRARIDRLGLEPLFDHVIISEEVGMAKPDPAIFDWALERMGRPKREHVLMVGDALSSDIQGGMNSGLHACWFNPERQPCPAAFAPTYEVTCLEELLPLVGLSPCAHAQEGDPR